MSILRFLLLMLLAIITLVSFTAALAGYRSNVSKAEKLFDQNLANFARALSVFPTQSSLSEPLPLEGIAVQVWQHHRLMAKSGNVPDDAIVGAEPGFSETNFNGQRWRAYYWQGPDQEGHIIVAEPLSKRIELAETMALASMTPLVYVTPLLGVLIAFTIGRGLSPLKKLSELLREKQANDFTPIHLASSPAELQPVLSTINRLLRKVSAAFDREKRFSSDAAHELRTPISVLQVGIHNLSTQRPELANELERLQQGVQRMSHVVEQILQLNRTHPDNFKSTFQRLELSDLCQHSIAHCYDAIDSKQQTVELKPQPTKVQGDIFALSTLLNNLILNASKYTPAQGDILVCTESTLRGSVLTVEDSGPGIKEQEYERVLDRFYRSGGDRHTSEISGCGLGMAIVKQVVDLHGAEISLARSTLLGGLKVTIVFPPCEPEQPA